jgi:hypothetical protein
MLELDRGGNYRVVDDRVSDDLAGSRATEDGGSFEVGAKLIYEFTLLYQGLAPKAKTTRWPSASIAGKGGFHPSFWNHLYCAILMARPIYSNIRDISPNTGLLGAELGPLQRRKQVRIFSSSACGTATSAT